MAGPLAHRTDALPPSDPRPVRVVLTGPECTGKTTLAATLAAHFGAPWTEEAARHYAESSATPLSAASVEPIARLSMRMEDEALAASPALLIRDTDLVSTIVYARHYYGSCPAWILETAAARLADLYLLGAPDLPWTPDGVRDRPAHREALFDDFAGTLSALGARVTVIRGMGEERSAAAIGAVSALLADSATRPSSPPPHPAE
jgi:nicotinamide riboside kinase